MQQLMDATAIDDALQTLAGRVLSDPAITTDLVLVGIRSRGELIAQRLADQLKKQNPNLHLDLGILDITMYRDDLASKKSAGITIPRGTLMDFRLDDRIVLLCDDVLETGRSIRAALDALVDFGRPRIIRLAVLVDRGRREFPIAADYVGLKIDAPEIQKRIIVHLTPTDSEDAVYLQETPQ